MPRGQSQIALEWRTVEILAWPSSNLFWTRFNGSECILRTSSLHNKGESRLVYQVKHMPMLLENLQPRWGPFWLVRPWRWFGADISPELHVFRRRYLVARLFSLASCSTDILRLFCIAYLPLKRGWEQMESERVYAFRKSPFPGSHWYLPQLWYPKEQI